MLYKMLDFSEMYQNCKMTFYKTLLENLAGFAIKVSKTFSKNACFIKCKFACLLNKECCLLYNI